MIRTFVVLTTLLVCTAPASAQTALERERLQKEIDQGRELILALAGANDALVTRVRAIDGDALTVDAGSGMRRIAFADVSRISRKGDGVGNGALIGMAVFGGWCAYVCGQGLDSGGQAVLAVLVNASVGAGIGALIDAGHAGTTTLYQRPANVRVGASASPRHVGIRMTMAW